MLVEKLRVVIVLVKIKPGKTTSDGSVMFRLVPFGKSLYFKAALLDESLTLTLITNPSSTIDFSQSNIVPLEFLITTLSKSISFTGASNTISNTVMLSDTPPSVTVVFRSMTLAVMLLALVAKETGALIDMEVISPPSPSRESVITTDEFI